MRSIIQREKRCYKTGDSYDLHRHHIFGGARRRLSEKYGLTVWLRADWHNMAGYGVHFDRQFDLELKQTAQRAFERTHSREEFISIFGKNYILEDREEAQRQMFGEDDFQLTEPEALFVWSY